MKKLFLILLLALAAVGLPAQDLAHYKRVVKALSSSKYQGRGYARGGANKAGKYLAKQYKKAGVDEITLQPFTIDINTFNGKMEMWADGKKLTAGVDFSMREYSPGVHGEFPVYHVDTLNYDADRMFEDLAKPEYANALVCCDFWFAYRHKEFSRLQKAGECANAGLIQTWTSPIKFYKAYGHRVADKPIVWVTPEAIEGVKSVRLDVDNEFLKDYGLFNVIAKVEGARHDSCYVFTAHYDHLGNLGRKIFYAGANDNASGTAAIVTLEQIKYLFNIDMIGDNNPVQYCECSDEGMRGFALFEKINSEKGYFKSLNRGELAANSDHYPFATRHVPCIFLENEDGDAFPWYHTIYDNWKHAVFDSYEPVFKLVTDFVEQY